MTQLVLLGLKTLNTMPKRLTNYAKSEFSYIFSGYDIVEKLLKISFKGTPSMKTGKYY